MNMINFKRVLIFGAIFWSLEILSILSFSSDLAARIIFLAVLAAAAFVSIRSLSGGVSLVLAELLTGSKGYLLFFPLAGERMVSLRLALWSLIMAIFFIRIIYAAVIKKEWRPDWEKLKGFFLIKPYLLLALFVLIGVVSGWLRGNAAADIFLDFNAWIYFLILLPCLLFLPRRERLIEIFLAGVIAVSLKTWILLAVFSNSAVLAPAAYAWLRRTLVGEMTAATGWNRVFIQSQIYAAIAFIFLLFQTLRRPKIFNHFSRAGLNNWLLGSLFLSAVVISLSRSFWLGLAAALLFSGVIIIRNYSSRAAISLAPWLASVAVGALLLIVLATPKLFWNFGSQLAGRLGNQQEAAVVSRWALLPQLAEEISGSPLIGYGFGKTVTYISSDPRIRQSQPDGQYTTYAFEWGYLDIWLKIGLLGLAAYLWLLYSLIKNSLILARKNGDAFYYGLAASLVFLAAVHMFTPYLNHPLGIGFIVASSCLIARDRVY